MFGTAEMTSSSAPHESANAAAISNAFRPHLDSSEPTATLVMVLFKCIRLPSSSVYGTTTIGQYAYAGRLVDASTPYSSAMALAFDRISCASLCAALSSPMAVYVASNDTAA